MAGYFVAPDAYGDIWIWRANGEYPNAVIDQSSFRKDPELWDRLTAGMEVRG